MTPRGSIAILGVCLALTVFFTSIVLETQQGESASPRVVRRAIDASPMSFNAPATPYLGGAPLVALSTAPGAAQSDADELVTRAAAFYDAGNKHGAIELCRSALKRDPTDMDAKALLGCILFSDRQYEEAERCLSECAKADAGGSPLIRARLGVAQMRLGRYEPALENLRGVLREQPRDGALHFALACTHAKLGDQELALQHLRVASELLGGALLQHISDPQLDSLRESCAFQKIVRRAVRAHQHRAASASEDGETSG